MAGKKNKGDDDLLHSAVKDHAISRDSDVNSIFASMASSGGFESRNLADGVDILKRMIIDEPKCTKFLSFVAALMSTGARGIVRDMLKNRMFDVVITTCGALDHDIARSYDKYYAGDFRMDDMTLLKKKVHRLGNVLVPMTAYGPLIEEKVQKCLSDMYKAGHRDVSTYEIADYIGSTLGESSFLYWAHKNKIPVIVPGIVDGAVGSQIWLFNQQHKDFKLNLLKDETKLSDMVFGAEKSGAFMIGGGISKHHTLWWNQYRGGLDYAVYITTAPEWDGSLSGALVAEAISWGKVTTKARQTTIHGEASTLLPFIYAALAAAARR
ncbi:deoxyhypusine synthase [Nitrososphaera viennensis]|uniref:Deoxyhypusine synthase n=2 Tax=Nitrososphaera viennensis TaxID=1034015 RepID=A0A060HJS1_9ARCH|nr:deoxyhypusine synthase [Nitrososphaera viennensis]AIC16794.1 deoxyhypusine synthase [Nitrososphaera viennensis EN76]UVS68699.1 deoxyhypusine synthase [Nitrososphaera viennensis]